MSEMNICKNCGHLYSGRYCNNCGEKLYSVKDRSLRHLAEESFHFLFHFEGTLITTLKTFFKKPGLVSVDYCNGIRRKYFKPLSLFLLLVVIYLIFPLFQGLNMQMHYYAENKLYGHYATNKIIYLLKHSGLTGAQIAETFHHKAEKISKFLLIIIIPLNALWFWLLTFKKRKYFFDQVVFSAEINCIYLLWGFMIFPILLFGCEELYHLISNSYFDISDDVTGLIMFSGMGIYIGIAARRFYNLKKWQSVIFAMLFCVIHPFVIILIYKFILFAITINQIY
ncbi:MAG: DUF3667 domain-containing protein [Ferruginibacter sp.]